MPFSSTTFEHEHTAPAEESEERLLLREAEAGQTLAFERIAWRYDEAILSLLLQLTSSQYEAIALCRTTFLSAYTNLARRNEKSLYIWLHRLAASAWLKHGSRRRACQQLSRHELLVFTLKAKQRLGLGTVARILDVSEESVAKTFCRAVLKLRQTSAG